MVNKELYKILIVEDEILVAYTIKEMLKELSFKSTTIANKYEQAKNLLDEAKIDLAILDINLGNGDEGIELAKICHKKEIPFFYLTSYTDKATLDKALETTPGAYLIKPFLQSNLYTALQISISTKSDSNTATFCFKDGTELVCLKSNEIIYLEAENVYVKIHTISKNYLYRSSLSLTLAKLQEKLFIQTHRSFAVNVNYITKIATSTVEMGELEIPLSRSYKNSVLALFEVSKD
jgi:DNA-binding LytR/AlgR family response regulator